MSATEHTPGPWKAHGREDGRGTTWTVGRDEIGPHYTLARVFRPHGDGPEVTQANARLIASAADLLEALEAILRQYDSALQNWQQALADAQSSGNRELAVEIQNGPLCVLNGFRIAEARAAIAKARGQS